MDPLHNLNLIAPGSAVRILGHNYNYVLKHYSITCIMALMCACDVLLGIVYLWALPSHHVQ